MKPKPPSAVNTLLLSIGFMLVSAFTASLADNVVNCADQPLKGLSFFHSEINGAEDNGLEDSIKTVFIRFDIGKSRSFLKPISKPEHERDAVYDHLARGPPLISFARA